MVLAMMNHTGRTGSWCSTWPVTGSSQVAKPPPSAISPPRATEPTARITIGTVMSAGDSWGCWAGPSGGAVQRLSPWNTAKKSRDM